VSPADACRGWGHHRWSAVGTHTADDLARYLTKSPHDVARGDNFRRRLSAFLTPEAFPVFVHRVAHFLYVNQWRRLAAWLTGVNFYLHKLNIPPDSCIGPGLRLPHPAGVTFQGRAGRGLTIYSLAMCCADWEHWGLGAAGGPCLGDHVSLGARALAQGPISVADGTTLAQFVVLTKDAPAGVIVASRSVRVALRGPGTGQPIREAHENQ
jgi:serine O-acetyltransferase